MMHRAFDSMWTVLGTFLVPFVIVKRGWLGDVVGEGSSAVTVRMLQLDLLDGLGSQELAASDYYQLPAVS